jgi:hypothetical protein
MEVLYLRLRPKLRSNGYMRSQCIEEQDFQAGRLLDGLGWLTSMITINLPLLGSS